MERVLRPHKQLEIIGRERHYVRRAKHLGADQSTTRGTKPLCVVSIGLMMLSSDPFFGIGRSAGAQDSAPRQGNFSAVSLLVSYGSGRSFSAGGKGGETHAI